MAIEYRNGRPYFYRKKRQGNRVISEYRGSGELAEIIAVYDELENQEKEEERKAQGEKQALHRQADGELLDLERTLDKLFASVALASGYHKPKRQWRKKRMKQSLTSQKT